MLLCCKGEPNRRLGNSRLLVGQEVLLAVVARGGGGLLDVSDEGLAGPQGLVRADGDHGVRGLRDCFGRRHDCELEVAALSSVVSPNDRDCLFSWVA